MACIIWPLRVKTFEYCNDTYSVVPTMAETAMEEMTMLLVMPISWSLLDKLPLLFASSTFCRTSLPVPEAALTLVSTLTPVARRPVAVTDDIKTLDTEVSSVLATDVRYAVDIVVKNPSTVTSATCVWNCTTSFATLIGADAESSMIEISALVMFSTAARYCFHGPVARALLISTLRVLG
jgi:hypothetical protein